MIMVSYWSLEYLLGRWRPTIGDPGFMGWFTVGSYFACAIVALIAVLSHRTTPAVEPRPNKGTIYLTETPEATEIY